MSEPTQENPGVDDLISLADAAQIAGFTHPHMRLLARRGQLWAVKIGRNWLTTQAAVEAYLAKDRRPGPKPKVPLGLEIKDRHHER